jgi:hypothetical protein
MHDVKGYEELQFIWKILDHCGVEIFNFFLNYNYFIFLQMIYGEVLYGQMQFGNFSRSAWH